MRTGPVAVLISLVLPILATAQHQQTTAGREFVIDSSKPYVYLVVDHRGRREPRNDEEPPQGFWLHLHNNCRVPIIIRTFGVPPGSPAGEIGVLDNVVANPAPEMGDGSVTSQPGPPVDTANDLGNVLSGSRQGEPKGAASSAPSAESAPVGMPHGYMYPTSSSVTIGPGQSVYFSIPRNQISVSWHVEIPFHFDLKVRSSIREPLQVVTLYEEDLPRQ
jgi:hypothetical protein